MRNKLSIMLIFRSRFVHTVHFYFRLPSALSDTGDRGICGRFALRL